MRLIDLTDRRFGRLRVVERAPSSSDEARWLCSCDCGATTTASGSNLRRGRVQSCGCLRFDWASEHTPSHLSHGHAVGGTVSATYSSWRSMVQRCTNPNKPKWPDYGGRGITVCERWLTFENFLADMGEKPDGMSIDRIDVDGNYELTNCRWATPVEQSRNQRRHQGKEWAT